MAYFSQRSPRRSSECAPGGRDRPGQAGLAATNLGGNSCGYRHFYKAGGPWAQFPATPRDEFSTARKAPGGSSHHEAASPTAFLRGDAEASLAANRQALVAVSGPSAADKAKLDAMKAQIARAG